jgi:hypothetical protein
MTPEEARAIEIKRQIAEWSRQWLKHGFRFVVMRPDQHCSSVWYAQSANDQYFIGVRQIGTKISLKAGKRSPSDIDGFCMLGVENRDRYERMAAQSPVRPKERAIIKWKRLPKPMLCRS